MPVPNPPQLRNAYSGRTAIPGMRGAASAPRGRTLPASRTYAASSAGTDALAAPASTVQTLVRDGLLWLLLFLLLWEWLRPMPQLSDASESSITPFLYVFGISILLDWWKVPYLLGWVMKSAALLVLVGYLFYPNAVTDLTWLKDYALLLTQDGMQIVHGHLDRVSPQNRTVLFMFGWMLLLTVAGAVMVQRQHALWIVAGTLIYLIVLQLTLGMDTTIGIIRTWGIGLFLLALLNLPRLERKFGFKPGTIGWPFRWVLVSLLVVALTAGVGWMGYQSQTMKQMKPLNGSALLQQWESYMWQDPQGRGKVAAEVSRSGYGEDDSSLGERLMLDNSLIFTAVTSELSYWRGESKSIYDGKGWSGFEPQWRTYEAVKTSESLDADAFVQEITWNGTVPNKQIFYSGKLEHVDTILSDRAEHQPVEFLLWDIESGKGTLPQIADPISYYQITVSPIRKDTSLLMKDKASYPTEVTDNYLQLPATLPQRVRQLAERITTGQDGPYAKAEAIEQYLRSTYAYSLDKPTLPARNEDFVSHFLFVDQSGYCDHFSTAMVVMLRSVGVPARWVKGYAPGEAVPAVSGTEQIGSSDSLAQTVQVRAKDAHSWVEVYFPSSGWVPFEPTPGFTGQSPQSLHETVAKSIVQQLVTTALSSLSYFEITADFILDQWRWIAVSVGSLGLLLGLLLLAGKIIRPQSASNNRIRLMDQLWLKIFRLFGAKPVHQTLREYIGVLKVSDGVQRQALLDFLRLYEGLRYDREERLLLSRKQIWQVWKSIKNKGAR